MYLSNKEKCYIFLDTHFPINFEIYNIIIYISSDYIGYSLEIYFLVRIIIDWFPIQGRMK